MALGDSLLLLSNNSGDFQMNETHANQSYSVRARYHRDCKREVQAIFGPVFLLANAYIWNEAFVRTDAHDRKHGPDSGVHPRQCAHLDGFVAGHVLRVAKRAHNEEIAVDRQHHQVHDGRDAKTKVAERVDFLPDRAAAPLTGTEGIEGAGHDQGPHQDVGRGETEEEFTVDLRAESIGFEQHSDDQKVSENGQDKHHDHEDEEHDLPANRHGEQL